MYRVFAVFYGLGYAVPVTATTIPAFETARSLARTYYRLHRESYPLVHVKVMRDEFTVYTFDDDVDAAGL